MTLTLSDTLQEAEFGPSVEQLAQSPSIDNWWIIRSGRWLRACGALDGHPDIKDPFVTTSPILGFDEAAGWMRTLSRFYKLGNYLEFSNMQLVDVITPSAALVELVETREALRSHG